MSEKQTDEVILTWDGKSAPNCYKRFFPSASELHWIAYVPENLVPQFIQFLEARAESSVQQCPAGEHLGGGVLFCGPLGKQVS